MTIPDDFATIPSERLRSSALGKLYCLVCGVRLGPDLTHLMPEGERGEAESPLARGDDAVGDRDSAS